MSSFTWLEEYKIGDETIDQQHQYLFDLANQIVDPDNDQQKTHMTVLALYHYVREHFKDEEAFMVKLNYPGYEEHVKEHEDLRQKLTEIGTGILSGDISSEQVMEFMRSWLLEHILGKDVPLGEFLRQKNKEKATTAES